MDCDPDTPLCQGCYVTHAREVLAEAEPEPATDFYHSNLVREKLQLAADVVAAAEREAQIMPGTAKDSPGHAAHDAWCADNDWYQLSEAERAQWEKSGQEARSWQLADAPAPHKALERADAFLAFNGDLQQDIENVICLPLQSLGRPLQQPALTLNDLRALAGLARTAVPHAGENVPPAESHD